MRPLLIASVLFLAAAAACHDATGNGGDGGIPRSNRIEAVSSLPDSAWLQSSVALAARVTTAEGKPVAGVAVHWSATLGGFNALFDTATVVTDTAGIAATSWYLLGNGPQIATARLDSAHAVTFTTRVVRSRYRSVSFDAPFYFLALPGDTVHPLVFVEDTAGKDYRPEGVRSLDTTVVTYDPAGRVTARGFGRTFIEAWAGPITTRAEVIVEQRVMGIAYAPTGAVSLAAGDSAAVTARAYDQLGRTIASTTLAWTSSNPAVAAVTAPGNGARGTIHGMAPGRTTVTIAGGGTQTDVEVVVGGASALRAPAAGETASCAASPAGVMYCWGSLRSSAPPVTQPQSTGFPAPLQRATVGGEQACALSSALHGWCWGQQGNGALGTGHVSPAYVAFPDSVDTPLPFSQVAAGARHTCALGATGAVYCWGSYATSVVPVAWCYTYIPCQADSHAYAQVDAWGDRTCGVTLQGGGAQAGEVWCWGEGFGRFAVQVMAGRAYTRVTVGQAHVCALSGGAAWCTGDNRYGQLGSGDTTSTAAALAVAGGHAFTAIDAGMWFTCGVDGAGQAWCWGRNLDHELGNPAAGAWSTSPFAVAGGHTFASVSGGQAHACAQASDGVWCWGNNALGQLGDGTTTSRASPVRVAGQP